MLEDTARFVRNDKKTTVHLARLRHALDLAARRAYPKLLAARNSACDVSRARAASAHKNLRGLVTANFRRTQESLRVLEEYGRLISAGASRGFARIRFSLYDMEKIMLAVRGRIRKP